MNKLTLDVRATELEEMKELIHLCVEFYLDMPEEMRVRYDKWEDKIRGLSDE